MRRTLSAPRPAFTITELLVALALIILIMSIMAGAFSSASKLIRDLRAANDLAERLRGTLSLMRNDLSHYYLDEPKRRLGDGTWVPNSASNKGFFRLYQLGRPTYIPADTTGNVNYVQPADSTGLMSGSSLQFTVRLKGLYPQDFFASEVPLQLPTVPTATANPLLTADTATDREKRYQSSSRSEYRGQWAEVTWWLTPQAGIATGQDLDPTTPAAQAGAQQLYTLRRRMRVLWDRSSPVSPTMPWVARTRQFRDISIPELAATPTPGTGFHVNTPSTIAFPALRFGARTFTADRIPPNTVAGTVPLTDSLYAGLPQNPAQPFGTGTDVNDDVPDYVLGDVLSFDVRVLLAGSTDFVDLGHPSVQAYRSGNPAYNPGVAPHVTTPTYVFDTWTNQDLGQFQYSARDSADPMNPDYVQRWERYGTLATVPLYKRWDTTVSPNRWVGDEIRIRAIQITLRLWDEKSSFTRQVTLVQEL